MSALSIEITWYILYLNYCIHPANLTLLSNYCWLSWRNWQLPFFVESKTFFLFTCNQKTCFMFTSLENSQFTSEYCAREIHRYVTQYSFHNIKFHFEVSKYSCIKIYVKFILILNSWLLRWYVNYYVAQRMKRKTRRLCESFENKLKPSKAFAFHLFLQQLRKALIMRNIFRREREFKNSFMNPFSLAGGT